MKRSEARQRMKSLLLFLPQLVALCGRLLKDKRVPKTEKALLAGAIVYAVMPFDFIPDMIPFVGQIDDAYLISLALLRLVNHTNEEIVREHWHGGGDILQLTNSLATIAPLILPKRIRRVLSSRIERTPIKKDSDAAKLASMKFVEVPEEKIS